MWYVFFDTQGPSFSSITLQFVIFLAVSKSYIGASGISVPLYRCLPSHLKHIALSNGACLRSEGQAQESQADFGVHLLSLQFLQRMGHISKCKQIKPCASKMTSSCLSSFVRSLALASLSPPMIDPIHLHIGRSRTSTDAQNRVGLIHHLSGFARVRNAVTRCSDRMR